MPAWQWIISGRVQGVGFRWYVHRQAAALGLDGFVRNLPDGNVEVVARGPIAELVALDKDVRAGPRSSRVARVEKVEYPHEMSIGKSFDIR